MNCRYFMGAVLAMALACMTPQQVDAKEFKQGIKEFFGMAIPAAPDSVRVLVAQNQDHILIEAKAGYNVYDPYKGERLNHGIFSKKFIAVPLEDGIRWGEKFVGVYQLTLAPDEKQKGFIVNGIECPGRLHIYQVEGFLHVINEVPIETFVVNQLAAHLEENYPQEVMAALCMAQRSEAWYYAQRGKERGYFWDVAAEDVGYAGARGIPPSQELKQASKATAGFIITREQTYQAPPRALLTKWTEDAAGRTAPYTVMFRKKTPTDVDVSKQFPVNDADVTNWRYALTKSQLAAALNLPDVDTVKPLIHAPSHKVYSLKMTTSEGVKNVSFIDLQRILGPAQLQSSDFILSEDGNLLSFEGVGKGHGVGMCLWEATRVAKQGFRAHEILGHFFPGVNIVCIDEHLKKKGD